MIRHEITVTIDQTDDHDEDQILGAENLRDYLEGEFAGAIKRGEAPTVILGGRRLNVSFTVVPGTVKVERVVS